MSLKLDIERLRTIDEVRDFMAGSEPVDFPLTERRGAYEFVTRALRRLGYGALTKADKGVVRRLVAKVTGLSRAQCRFIPAWAGNTAVVDWMNATVTVHPRVGGEHHRRRGVAGSAAGSSPRGRGTLDGPLR